MKWVGKWKQIYLSKQYKMKKYNFSAGPSILAKNVIKEAAKSVSELNNIGLSLLEFLIDLKTS